MKSESLPERIEEAVAVLRARSGLRPRFGIILGTGLGGLTREVEVDARIPYAAIPHFPELRATSHEGALVLGTIAGQPVAAFEGRYHLYDGHSLEEVTFPVRVMKALGVKVAIISNAAGGLNPSFRRGDIMIISDHLNLMGVNPLIGPNDERLGPRFPDMIEPYSLRLVERLEAIALEARVRAWRGVYAAMTGPCLETRAEYRMLRTLGADAVGMSTVPEVIVAVHAGLDTVGLSCITDTCIPDTLEPLDIAKILRVAAEAEPKMTLLVRRLIEGSGPGT